MNNLSRPKRRFGLTVTVAVFWVAYLAILVVMSKVKSLVPAEMGQLVWGVVCSMLLVVLTLILLRHDGRAGSAAGFGLDSATPLRFAVGGLAGLAIHGLILVVFMAFVGPIPLAWSSAITPGQVILLVATFLALSCMEELGFRGYPLHTLVQKIGFWPAQATVAAGFALCHILYGWSWQSLWFGVLPSGLLFGISAVASRGPALPIGLHAGLNLKTAVGPLENEGVVFFPTSYKKGACHSKSELRSSWISPLSKGFQMFPGFICRF